MIERDVIIAGAGPVGLTAALALRSVDRPVTVVEEGAIDRVRAGSRAIFIHRTALLVLERIKQGLGQEWELARSALADQTHTLPWSRSLQANIPPASSRPAAPSDQSASDRHRAGSLEGVQRSRGGVYLGHTGKGSAGRTEMEYPSRRRTVKPCDRDT